MTPWPEELLNARIMFWVCPDHYSAWPIGSTAPHPPTVEWVDRVAHCTVTGCPRTSANTGPEDYPDA